MSTDLLSRIKDIPVSEIINLYLPLQSKGRDSIGVCPFHDDHSPSMHVSDSKGLFKCFACGAGGDAISFVQRFSSIDFKEALIEIGQKFNLPVDELINNKKKDPRYEMAEKINKVAVKIFKKSAEAGAEEFNKFIKNRDLPSEIVSQFSLGYAPGNNALSSYLESLQGSEREKAIAIAREIGIIRPDKNDPEKSYDTFRHRVIFPIWDQYNNVVGFGSRAVFENQKGKYINSQESIIFNKKNILYGLNFAKISIRKQSQAILTEGYMDCISMIKNGYENTVAVMGTALSETCVKTLASMAKDIILALDNDQAGFAAATRMNQLFLENGIIARVLDLGDSKDPDEFLGAHGNLALKTRIDDAQPMIDLLIEKTIPNTIPELTDRKLGVLQKIFSLVAPLGDSLSATERVLGAAKKLGLSSTDDQILEAYKTNFKGNKKRPSVATLSPAPAPTQMTHEVSEETQVSEFHISPSEQVLLEHIGRHPECFKSPDFKGLLDYVGSSEVQNVIHLLQEVYLEVEEAQYSQVAANMLKADGIELPILEAVCSGLYHHQPKELDEKKLNKMVSDLDKKLKQLKLLNEREVLKEQQKNCENNEEAFAILKQLNNIQQELNSLRR